MTRADNSGNNGLERAKGSVLVVDDDPVLADQIAWFLMKHGVEVIVEHNGYAALARMKRIEPAVILMDVKMPGLDGVEVARLIGRLHRKPKVILMSGHGDAVQKASQEGLDVHAVIHKPVPLRIFLKFVRQALAG